MFCLSHARYAEVTRQAALVLPNTLDVPKSEIGSQICGLQEVRLVAQEVRKLELELGRVQLIFCNISKHATHAPVSAGVSKCCSTLCSVTFQLQAGAGVACLVTPCTAAVQDPDLYQPQAHTLTLLLLS